MSSCKIKLTWVDWRLNSWEGAHYVDAIIPLLREACPDSEIVEHSGKADMIWVCEGNARKDASYVQALNSHPTISQRPEDAFTLNYDVDPIGYLPGCYVSMPRHAFDAQRHRATGYALPYNWQIEKVFRDSMPRTPSYLLSFCGADSAPVRRRLFDLAPSWPARCAIQRSTGWFNYSENQQAAYADSILQGKFSLCPRGLAVTTHRLFESMELGRVPVILADDWVPPTGPDWDRFSLRVPEREVANVYQWVEAREPEWEQMAALARQAWEEWFSPEVRMRRMLEWIGEIRSGRQVPEAEVRRCWNSQAFLHRYGRSRWQRGRSRLRRLVIKLLDKWQNTQTHEAPHGY